MRINIFVSRGLRRREVDNLDGFQIGPQVIFNQNASQIPLANDFQSD
jgi:hypothetical protein